MLKRKILILGVLVVTVAIVFLITRPKEELSTDYTIPQNTKMILHFSTLTNTTTNFFPKPTSLIYFCDEAGAVIGELEKKEEVMRNFIVNGEDTVAFLFKNNTILATTNGYTDIKPNSDIFIHKDRFGPSKTGYLEDKNLFYSLLNVGRRPNEEDYINTVRFVSEEQNYDVMIPYHLECISYDCVDKRFICMVSDLNDSLTEDTYNYVVLYYDEEINQFVFDETLYEVPYPEERYYNAEDRSFTATLANNGYLYIASTTDTEEYVKDVNSNGVRTHKNLILTTVDMEKRIATDTMLKENYHTDELGYGVLTGSDHLPMEAIGDKLYVFTSEFDVFVIKNQDEITQQ